MTKADYEPTALDFLVGDLEKTSKFHAEFEKVVVPVTVRMEGHLYGLIEAMAEQTSKSRNNIINQLIQVGISATIQALDEQLSEALCKRADSIHEAMLDTNIAERGQS